MTAYRVRPSFRPGRTRRCWGAVAALALGACASTVPTHYHSLLAPSAAGGAGAPSAPALGEPFELLPVGVPPQVDQPQLVVRSGGERVLPLEHERWIAPLADELRTALSQDLAQRLGVPDVSSQIQSGTAPVLRIKVEVRRFDSAPGEYAALDAVWSLSSAREGGHAAALVCRSQLRESAAAGYDELVRAHQRALDALAAQIAAAARARVGGSSACP